LSDNQPYTIKVKKYGSLVGKIKGKNSEREGLKGLIKINFSFVSVKILIFSVKM
jgi:hypothetical protein